MKITIFCSVFCSFLLYSTINAETARRLCGKVLNEVLAIVCEEKYNTLPLKKSGKIMILIILMLFPNNLYILKIQI